MPIRSYENEILFICKLNSFSYDGLCTRPILDRKGLGQLGIGLLPVPRCTWSLILVFSYTPQALNVGFQLLEDKKIND